MKKEILEKRTFNSEILDNQDGSFTLNAHVGHINYLDKNTGKLEKINTEIIKKGQGWEMKKAGYEVKLPQKSNQAIKFFVNKFDKDIYKIRQKEIPQLVKTAQFKGQDNVEFTLSKINGVLIKEVQGVKTKHNQITYSEIAPNIDLQLSCGHNSFKKEIIIKKKPEFTGDFFEIEFLTNRSKYQALKGKFQIDSIHFRDAKVWDSKRKSESIEIGFLGGFLIKRIPREFLEKADYPIRTDTTTSYYGGGVDGAVGYTLSNQTFTTIRNANGDYSSDATDENGVYIRSGDIGETDKWDLLRRAIIVIDTSGLPDNAIIGDPTSLELYGDDTYGPTNSFSLSLIIDHTTIDAVNHDALVVADYNIADWDDTKQSDTVLAVANWSVISYNSFALNAVGKGNISKVSVSEFGLRYEADRANSPPTWAANTTNYCYFTMSEEAGETYDPYLSVTYTLGTGSGMGMMGFFGG